MSSNPQIAAARRQELDALVAQHGGTITPAQVVAFASDPATALHSVFQWDDNEAGRLYREQQAAQYLRVVMRLVPRDNAEPMAVRAFVSLSGDRGTGIYRPMLTVLSDDEQRAQLVHDALAELTAFRRKYAHLNELADVFSAVEAVTGEVQSRAA